MRVCGRFAAMIAASTVVMYGVMYLNTFAFEHIRYSQTRIWMALLMGSVMSVIMLLFMLGMYKSEWSNSDRERIRIRGFTLVGSKPSYGL